MNKTQIIVFSFRKKKQGEQDRLRVADALPSPKPSVDDGNAHLEGSDRSKKSGFLSRLRKGLAKTSALFSDDLGSLLRGKIDDELLEDLEARLLMADVGVEATQKIVDKLNSELGRKQKSDAVALMDMLHQQMQDILEPCSQPLALSSEQAPFVILVVGVNGVGKTTTIGKLAKQLQQQNKTVILAAGDTFRAAAVEQLQTWGKRNNVPVISQGQGADSASVIFDAMQAASARKIDVLIADTAGRLHTQQNLMEELKKVKRVTQKLDPTAPHEIMLVVDAGTGQNALNQARQFNLAVGVTGITVTKLDGTAKGGILFAIANELGIPIRFIGIGEGVEDLRVFDAKEFVKALLMQNTGA